MSLLGINGAPVTYAHELPPKCDETYLAGSLQYHDSQKTLIYLSPKWPREVTEKKLKYLGAHEGLEILLIDSFLEFAEESVKNGVVDYNKWEGVVHDALNRILMLYDASMLTDIAEDVIFPEDTHAPTQ